MQSVEELRATLPPEIGPGVPGAADFNQARRRLIAELEPHIVHGAARLAKLSADDHAGRAKIEGRVNEAIRGFERAADKLKMLRARLMHEPKPGDDAAIAGVSTPLRMTAKTAALMRAANEAGRAYLNDTQFTDATRYAWNLARRKLADHAKAQKKGQRK